MKLCKDCAYFREVGMCYNDGNIEPIHGHPATGVWDLRRNPQMCGPKAAWFAPLTDVRACEQTARRRSEYLRMPADASGFVSWKAVTEKELETFARKVAADCVEVADAVAEAADGCIGDHAPISAGTDAIRRKYGLEG